MSGKDRPRNVLDAMAHRHYAPAWVVAIAAQTEFALPITVLRIEDVQVFVDGVLKQVATSAAANDYAVRGLTAGYVGDSNFIKFAAAPGVGAKVAFHVVGG